MVYVTIVSPKCFKCNKSVYAMEAAKFELKTVTRTFHKSCLKCHYCQIPLNSYSFRMYRDQIYCDYHKHIGREQDEEKMIGIVRSPLIETPPLYKDAWYQIFVKLFGDRESDLISWNSLENYRQILPFCCSNSVLMSSNRLWLRLRGICKSAREAADLVYLPFHEKNQSASEAFVYQCKYGNSDSVKFFLSNGIDPNWGFPSPISGAVGEDNSETLKVLLEDKRARLVSAYSYYYYGAWDFTFVDHPMGMAIKYQRLAMFDLLINDERLNVTDTDWNIALHYPCKHIIEKLLQKGFKADYNNLRDLVKKKNLEVVPLILHQLERREFDAFDWEIMGEKEVVTEVMKDNELCTYLWNPKVMQGIVKGKHLESAEMILKDERSNSVDFNRSAIFCLACEKGNLELVTSLLGDGRVDPSYQFNSGMNWAIKNGFTKIFTLLWNRTKIDLDSALDLAERSNSKEIIGILLKEKQN